MQGTQLFDLMLHCEWADATVWTAVLEHADSTSFDAADEKIVEWLHHIHLVQHAFCSVWSDEALDLENLPEPSDHDDLLALAAWGRSRHQRLQRFLLACDEREMERRLTFPWAAQMEAAWEQPLQPVTLRQSAYQLAMHSAHHRAQVSSRLRQVGGEPPPIDYIIWLWRGRPETVWPSADV